MSGEGGSLLSVISGKEKLSSFRTTFLRAGHAHAGVLLILALVYFLYLPRAEFSRTMEWVAGITFLVGMQMQAGGFFIHMARGTEGRSSIGTRMTRTGAFVIAAALITLAFGLAIMT